MSDTLNIIKVILPIILYPFFVIFETFKFIVITPIRLFVDTIVYGLLVLPFTITCFIFGINLKLNFNDLIEFGKIAYQYFTMALIFGFCLGLSNALSMWLVSYLVSSESSSIELFSLTRIYYYLLDKIPIVNGWVKKPLDKVKSSYSKTPIKTNEELISDKLKMSKEELHKFLTHSDLRTNTFQNHPLKPIISPVIKEEQTEVTIPTRNENRPNQATGSMLSGQEVANIKRRLKTFYEDDDGYDPVVEGTSSSFSINSVTGSPTANKIPTGTATTSTTTTTATSSIFTEEAPSTSHTRLTSIHEQKDEE